jgi:hypothetical protein
MAVFAIERGVCAKNVTFHYSKLPYYTVNLFGEKIFGTHGDTCLKPGNPGNKIDVSGMYQQALSWNTARGVGGPFKMFFCGHVHAGSTSLLPCSTIITNSCLIPPTPFSLSIGLPDTRCGQYLIESVPGHIDGDQRFLTVDGAEKSKSNQGIIIGLDSH